MKHKKWSRWMIGTGAFVVGATLTCFLVAALFYWLYSDHGSSSTDSPEPRAVYSRTDFSSLVMGKTEAEVTEAVGKPDKTSEDNEAIYWHYHKRTQDPEKKVPDSDVQIVFQKGKVAALNY